MIYGDHEDDPSFSRLMEHSLFHPCLEGRSSAIKRPAPSCEVIGIIRIHLLNLSGNQHKKPFQLFFRVPVVSDPASLFDQNDEIERPFDLALVKPKEFPQISFDSIPVGRLSDFFFHHDAQPVKRIFILLRKKDEVWGGESLS